MSDLLLALHTGLRTEVHTLLDFFIFLFLFRFLLKRFIYIYI